MNTWDKCKNCGGERGIHHWKTNQCPFGGVDASPNRPDMWTDSHFEKDDGDEIDALRQEIEELKAQVAALLDAVPSAKRR